MQATITNTARRVEHNPAPELTAALNGASPLGDLDGAVVQTHSDAEQSSDSESRRSNQRALVASLVIAGLVFGIGVLVLVISLL